MADFPPSGLKEDSSKGSDTVEDGMMRAKAEGGYQIIRPRTTRPERRLFSTGFTHINAIEKATLEAFQNNYKGSAFTYQVPYSEEVVTVQLEDRFEFSYTGYGGSHTWDTNTVTLREV